MHLKNILLVVKDIEKSKQFYGELFGLKVITDFGENVILTEGLVLQEKSVWESLTEKTVSEGANDSELYFEETDMDGFLKKLKESRFPVSYVNPISGEEYGRRVVRIYDPDIHIIEVAEKRH